MLSSFEILLEFKIYYELYERLLLKQDSENGSCWKNAFTNRTAGSIMSA